MVNDENFEQEEIERIAEIERLKAWDERVAAEKIANDKEAAELAIYFAQKRREPTLDTRVTNVEEVVNNIFGGAL